MHNMLLKNKKNKKKKKKKKRNYYAKRPQNVYFWVHKSKNFIEYDVQKLHHLRS